MRIKIFSDADKIRKRYEWHTWFAWHPVRIDGTLVWFEKVFRIRKIVSLKGMYWHYEFYSNDKTAEKMNNKECADLVEEYESEYENNKENNK